MRQKSDLFMEKALWVVRITEGFRTAERQNELYQQGRTTPWQVVTDLDGYNKLSNHQSWEAIDIAFTGTEPYPEDHSKWEMIARIGKECWLDWGYDMWGWDKPHFQDNGQDLPDLDRDKVQERNKEYMNYLEISDSWMDEPIPKRNLITINSLEFEIFTDKFLEMEKRISKLEDENTTR